MANDPINFDKHRGRAALMTGYREISWHRPHALPADGTALHCRQEDLKYRLLGATTSSWPDVVATAHYLVDLFTVKPRTGELRRREFTTPTPDDFVRPGDYTKERS